MPNNPGPAPRGGVRPTRQRWCANQLHFYASVARLRLHASVTPSLGFSHRITPASSAYSGVKLHQKDIQHIPVEVRKGGGGKSFHHGSARVELSARGLYGLWIFCVFLRGAFPPGGGRLQGEGEPKLLHRPEQRLFRVHEEQNGVLLRCLLSEDRGLLRGLPTRVPDLR